MIDIVQEVLDGKAVVDCQTSEEVKLVLDVLVALPGINSTKHDLNELYRWSKRCFRIALEDDNTIHHGELHTYVNNWDSHLNVYLAVDFLLNYSAKKVLESVGESDKES